MGFNLLITNRAGDVFFFHLSLLLLLLFLWPSSDHIWSCRQIARISAREISMSEYLIFPTLFLCISPSLHLSVSNTSCRARSWLIRALVANASSPSPAAEMNGDQMRPSYEVGCWVIGDTSSRKGREGEMKMRRRQMKRDEHLLWDVSALRSFVISGRTYETLEFIMSSLPAFDMRTPISLHFYFCLTFNTPLCTWCRWQTLLCCLSF